MPIYEYFCPDNHKIYQFYARTMAQGRIAPKCPDNRDYQMVKMISGFAVAKGGRGEREGPASPGPDGLLPSGPGYAATSPGEPGLEAAMGAMEREFADVDENDPRAMGRMMRRMAEVSGEKIEGEMEEVMRKLEEGADPDSLDFDSGDASESAREGAPMEESGADRPDAGPRRPSIRRVAPIRDPKLYDYE